MRNPTQKKISLMTPLAVLLLLTGTPAPCSEAFTHPDTARFMVSPEPLPLGVEKAFPHLRFERPLEITFDRPDARRLFVVEQAGRIHVFPNKPDVQNTSIFLDIRDRVSRKGNEEGLLGLAFHPKYARNGEFYVYYSTTILSRIRASVISRFRVSGDDPDRADPDSEEVLLQIKQPYSNHNGGSIRFGPDGYLYIGLGDGGAAHDPLGHGQNLKTLLGSILRIDVDSKDGLKPYAIPKDNPFVDSPAGACGEIWAYGVRNIWRLSFDRKTGDLWAGDVGQNRYEEVDRIVKGGNYGWKIREGFHPFDLDAPKTGDKFIEPLAEYFHSEGRSITGGLVYRGKRLSEYEGAYFYGDFVSGAIWMLRWDGKKVTENSKVAQTELAISAFGEDPSGAMYLTAFDGAIYRLRRQPPGQLARASAFPKKLSETGLYTDLEKKTPARSMIPYDVNVPLWSDHGLKERFMVLPKTNSIVFSEQGRWGFPVGTVLVKNFILDLDERTAAKRKMLETRLLVHSPDGWAGYTYLWNDAQDEAHLLDDALVKEYDVMTPTGPVKRKWYFPSRADCMACHAKGAGFVLGLTTPQLNRSNMFGAKPRNQVDHFNKLGLFTEKVAKAADALPAFPMWGSTKAKKEDLARAYLDVNCAFCHAPGALRGGRPDLRFFTPLNKASLINRNPGQGRLGPRNAKLITPGHPSLSELFLRMEKRGPRQMPPLATYEIDEEALSVLRQWIAALGQ